MALIEICGLVSLSLLAKNWAVKKSRATFTLPSLRTCVGAQVALQRCPILRTSGISLSYRFIFPFQKGHLYFAE